MTAAQSVAPSAARVAVVLKGYPRLSETFIAQELLGLQQAGVPFEIWSLRRPTDQATHPIHDQIQARARYLPEYLRREPLRVLRGLLRWAPTRAFWRAAALWARDLARDRTVNRVRRFGQALVLARELPPGVEALYAHFLHTPASVARYAAVLRGLPWGVSAHAKDIWTISDWEKREKLGAARFAVTCTEVGARHLASLAPDPARVALVYHGLELTRFPAPPAQRPPRDGSNPSDPVRILSVGRLVAKKGYDDLLNALAALPDDLAWRFEHIGGGPLKDPLRAQASALGVDGRLRWLGAQPQTDVIEALRRADLFVLPSRIAGDGDRDGLPNVLMEAASQELPVISTAVSAIPEFVSSPELGVLAPPEDPMALAAALANAIRDPAGRARRSAALRARLVERFGAAEGVEQVRRRLEALRNPSKTGVDGAASEAA